MVEVFLNDPVELNGSPERIEETIYREDQPSLSPDKPLRPAFTLELSKEREGSIERQKSLEREKSVEREKSLQIQKSPERHEMGKQIEESMERMAAEKTKYEKNFNSWSV